MPNHLRVWVNVGFYVHNFGLALGPIEMVYVGVGISMLLVNFDHCLLTITHPNPGLSVNEVEDPGATVGLKESLSAYEGW